MSEAAVSHFGGAPVGEWRQPAVDETVEGGVSCVAMFRSRFAALLAAGLVFAVPSGAAGTGELPLPPSTPSGFDTHFYTFENQLVPTPAGAPFLTPLGTSEVLTMDWDFEMAVVDVTTGAGRLLKSVNLPSGARVLDLVADGRPPEGPGEFRALVAYAVKNPDGCRRSVLQEITVDVTGSREHVLGQTWFTSPCYPFVAGSMYGEGLNQAGGRVVSVPRSMRTGERREYFFSVGDFELFGGPGTQVRPRSLEILGTVQRLSAPGVRTTFARGFRNIQGMTIARIDGVDHLVVSEHGPRGGDDINLVQEGKDYGWPRYSYGTAYGLANPESKPVHEGDHSRATPPLFSFEPSIGPTSIIQVKGAMLDEWWGSKSRTPDLIVNGMSAQLMGRIRIDRGAVRLVEGLRSGVRLRTLVQMPSGLFVGGPDKSFSQIVVFRPTQRWSTSAEAFVPF